MSHTHTPSLTQVTKTNKPGSIVEITGTLPKEHLAKERGHMLEILSHQIQVDGFRAGSIPEAMIVAKVGEDYIQQKTAEHALEHDLHHVLIEHGILPIVPPHIHVSLNADGSAAVTVTATIYPAVTLPDYKKIASEVMVGTKEVTVTDADVLDALTHFRRERLRVESIEAARGADGTLTTPEADILKKADETPVENLPPLDDEFVTQLGFADVAAFEEHVKKELHTGKTQHERSERRAKMLKAICEQSVADVPEPLIEYELAKMEASLADYLAQAGQTLEAYFAKVGKTRADIHAEWKPEALIRAQHQLALIEIAKREKISENESELETLVEDTMKRNPDASQPAVHSHYQVLLRNEATMQWLEQQK